ncbi:hypothetical protein [Portibacter lacus]|uniref:hypothetical protein n=1 Tax=Portibacter lacus TaxID=1099794 RepID=UPI001F39FEE7|nr:hypothetical protein [Portibacter lacus]
MKKVIILLFTLAVTLSSVRELVIYSTYYLNIEYISNQLCININEPELMCFGKCYLEDQLINQTSNNQEHSAKFLLDTKVNLICEAQPNLSSELKPVQQSKHCIFFYENHKRSNWLKQQFRPPIA